MNKTLLTLASAFMLLTACNSAEETNSTESMPADTTTQMSAPVAQETPLQAPVADTASNQMPDAGMQRATLPIANQQQPVTTNAAPAQATAPGMNPPHGPPGHRCDIAVGAPLKSPKGTAPSPAPNSGNQIKQAPVIQSQAPASPVPTATAPGMNPPHGQPGHDCAIPVGAPLKK